MRVEAASDALSAVTNDAVALDVAADAGIEVSHRLETVVARPPRRIAPLGLGRVEPAGFADGGRTAHGHPQPLMATEAEALLAMAARAFLHREPRLRRVHRKIVARVNAP